MSFLKYEICSAKRKLTYSINIYQSSNTVGKVKKASSIDNAVISNITGYNKNKIVSVEV